MVRAMNVNLAGAKVNKILSPAKGLTLQGTRFTQQGIELVFEGPGQRVDVSLIPKIYPQGRLIVDAINDLTLTVEVRRYALANEAAMLLSEERVELPYSTWFGEDFM